MTSERLKAADIFQCKKCGDCCKGYGGTYVTPEDMEAISRFLHTTTADVLANYCCMSGTKPVLTQQKNGYCIFWDKLCTIHPIKPRMCRSWPFLQAVVAAPQNWEIMAGFCPGIRTDIPDGTIVEIVKAEIKRMKASREK